MAETSNTAGNAQDTEYVTVMIDVSCSGCQSLAFKTCSCLSG